MTGTEGARLEDLRGHRGAPPLSTPQRLQLQAELRQRLAACEWFTIGVMAPSCGEAWAALRSFERALGWEPLPAPTATGDTLGPVFLKGHQRNGTVWLREEAGLAEGVLISGHSASDPAAEDTWGPLPLDLFARDPARGAEDAASRSLG